MWRELDEATVRDVAQRIAEQDVEAVAVALLHSYVNADARAAGRGDRAGRGRSRRLRHPLLRGILPEIREYERTSTAVVNAYVGPAITRYLGSLVDRLRRPGSRRRSR